MRLAAVAGLVCLCCPAAAQVSVSGKVVDENSVAIAGVQLTFRRLPTSVVATSDAAGSFRLSLERTGEWDVTAWRPGFFAYHGQGVRFDDGNNSLTITLNHLQELTESVDVAYSPPAIDLAQPADQKELNNMEILAVPYPAPQDFRSAFPLFSGVVQDVGGHPHFNGGETSQTNYTLDSFNLSDPFSGGLEARMNIDTVREMQFNSSRYSAENGRGSAGSVDIQTKMGDDRWRFGTTNFIPSISTSQGLHIDKWTPRVEVSGPIDKGRAWFHDAFDTFYDVNTIYGLPRGQNRTQGLTLSNLGRFQINLTPRHLLTGSFLLNYSDINHYGLSILDPLTTTTNRHQDLFLGSLKEQSYFSGGDLFEIGFAETATYLSATPRGTATYEITPFGRFGNYFVDETRDVSRQQGISNLFLKPHKLMGTHRLKVGVDAEREGFHQMVDRHPYDVLRTDNSLARSVSFTGNPYQKQADLDGAWYAQDSWNPREGLTIEGGIRSEWDEIIRSLTWSPRLAVAWAPKVLGGSKISAGWGIYRDSLYFSTLSLRKDQESLATFYGLDGLPEGPPVPTTFTINSHALHAPQYRTASLSIEYKLPFSFFGKASYVRRESDGGFAFLPSTLDYLAGESYTLHNVQHDLYSSFEISARRTFRQYEIFTSYTRSSARSSAVVDYSLENPIFAAQGPGPYPWDAPNRFLLWGWAPLPHNLLPRRLRFLTNETTCAYLAEYRTGFPFSIVNEEGFMIGQPNSIRFPDYFNVNFSLERRFRALHYLWAWRAGVINITNSGNPNVVNNNIDSPTFLVYGRGQQRAVTVRLRFLGKR